MSRSIWKIPFSLLKSETKTLSKSEMKGKNLSLRPNRPDLKNVLSNSKRETPLKNVVSSSSVTPQQHKARSNSIVPVWSRHSMILPENIGNQYTIYNGKQWFPRKVVEEMVGHKFGEFFSTKKRTIHKVNKKKQISHKK